MLVVAAFVWVVLLRLYGGENAQVQLDAIRTAGTLVVGTGGAVALLLAARRQRYTELSLVHTDRDAIERRITELYTKAADQLGSTQAPVRLAGLYALERLAHSTVEHRQTIVDVICAYLRMPYSPPPANGAAAMYRGPTPAQRRRARTIMQCSMRGMSASEGSQQERAKHERQVRLTAQDILRRNLTVTDQRRRWWQQQPPVGPTWSGIHLDLSEATLLDFSLTRCQLDWANFRGTQFIGDTNFRHARFSDRTWFESARFDGPADFTDAEFDRVRFTGAHFRSDVLFDECELHHVWFESTRFDGLASFEDTRFRGVLFTYARFRRLAEFRCADFRWGSTSFDGARFDGPVNFEGVQADGPLRFDRNSFNATPLVMTIASPDELRGSTPIPENGKDFGHLYLVPENKDE